MTMRTATITTMTTPTDTLTQEALLTLSQWLSPGYPVGAFAWSHGLEAAVTAGDITDVDSARNWIAGVLEHGAGRVDAVLLAQAWRTGDAAALKKLDALARSLAPSAERLAETCEQGAAFARTTEAIWQGPLPELTYPVALGRAARLQGMPLAPVLAMALHAFAANLVAAATRAVPLGQTNAQGVLAALAPLIRRLAQDAEHADAEDIGSCAFLTEVASMRHETQYSRMFRS